MIRKILPFSIIILIIACSAPKELSVINVQDLTRYPEGSSVYALPRTRLEVTICVISSTTIPGPYSGFAEEFLGIEGAAQEAKTTWEMRDIEIREFSEADPEYYYCMQSGKDSGIEKTMNILRERGLILMSEDLTDFQEEHSGSPEAEEQVIFTDMTVKKPSQLDNPGKRQGRGEGGVPTDLPLIRAKDRGETLRARAEEAAGFIIKIRKRRFKLLSGQYDVFPEGQALETSVRELNRLEQEYLSLFIGKTSRDTLFRTFYYTPTANQEIERKELCRFSEETGFSPDPGSTGRPVVLDLRNLRYTRHLRQLEMPMHGPGYSNMVLYRIPDKAGVKILYGSLTLLDAEVKVWQYGAMVPLQLSGK